MLPLNVLHGWFVAHPARQAKAAVGLLRPTAEPDMLDPASYVGMEGGHGEGDSHWCTREAFASRGFANWAQ